MNTDQQSPTPEMDHLVDEILRGERILLLPPGVLVFMSAGAGTAFGYAFMLASLVPWLLSDNSVPTRALSQVGGVLVGSTLATVAALMVLHAAGIGPRLWTRVTEIGLILALLTVGLAWNSGERYDHVAPLIAVGALGLAAALLRTVSFAMFVLFRQRLKARRKVLLDQLQAPKS